MNYLDYGARMYDWRLVRWFNIDALAEKYYGFSPYVYAGNSPVRYIDKLGLYIDEYFNTNGIYLGKDDALTDNIRVMYEPYWNMYGNGDGTINATDGQMNSVLFSEANITNDAAMNIYNHYNMTGIKAEFAEGEFAMQAKIDYRLFIEDGVVTRTEYSGESSFLRINYQHHKETGRHNNKWDLISDFRHEQKHFMDARSDASLFRQMNREEIEKRAINYQMSMPSWPNTTPNYKKSVINYLKSF